MFTCSYQEHRPFQVSIHVYMLNDFILLIVRYLMSRVDQPSFRLTVRSHSLHPILLFIFPLILISPFLRTHINSNCFRISLSMCLRFSNPSTRKQHFCFDKLLRKLIGRLYSLVFFRKLNPTSRVRPPNVSNGTVGQPPRNFEYNPDLE